MDHRDMARTRRWWKNLDTRRMVAIAELPDEWDTVEVEVPFRFVVCPTCDGTGHHVNPSVDAHGISPEEFAEDPDFAEDYMSGVYDVPCYECDGQRVVPEPDESTEAGKRCLEHMRFLGQCAAEEAYCARMGC